MLCCGLKQATGYALLGPRGKGSGADQVQPLTVPGAGPLGSGCIVICVWLPLVLDSEVPGGGAAVSRSWPLSVLSLGSFGEYQSGSRSQRRLVLDLVQSGYSCVLGPHCVLMPSLVARDGSYNASGSQPPVLLG